MYPRADCVSFPPASHHRPHTRAVARARCAPCSGAAEWLPAAHHPSAGGLALNAGATQPRSRFFIVSTAFCMHECVSCSCTHFPSNRTVDSRACASSPVVRVWDECGMRALRMGLSLSLHSGFPLPLLCRSPLEHGSWLAGAASQAPIRVNGLQFRV